jgi:hypothetical protein
MKDRCISADPGQATGASGRTEWVATLGQVTRTKVTRTQRPKICPRSKPGLWDLGTWPNPTASGGVIR